VGALVPTKPSRFAPIRAILSPVQPRLVPANARPLREPRTFSAALAPPILPMLELYAFICCQGGFRQLEMTFEQFLPVAAAIKPSDLSATREEAATF
jgi:hypothetical protein